MQKYKLAIAACATAQDALEQLDVLVQALYAQGYAGEHKAQLYRSKLGGLHVAYKELTKYETEPDEPVISWLVKTTAEAQA